MYEYTLICDQCRRVVGLSQIEIISGVLCRDCIKRGADGDNEQS